MLDTLICDVITPWHLARVESLEIQFPEEDPSAEFLKDGETCEKDTPAGDKEGQRNVYLILLTTVSAFALTTFYFALAY